MSDSQKRAAFVVCVGMLTATVAHAQLNRSAVSVQGLDTNTCAATSPCRSFAYAMSQTNPGGEVIALDSGGFGAFTADRAVIVQAAPGAYAGVTAASGNAVTIAAGSASKVVLRRLVLNGVGTGNAGIAATVSGDKVYVEGCSISGFVNYGIISFLNLRVSDTSVRDCGTGIWIDNAGGAITATIDHTTVKRVAGGDPVSPGAGIFAYRNTQVTVRDSLVTDATTAFEVDSGVLNLENCTATNSDTGLFAGNGVARISNCLVTGNITGLDVSNVGSIETWQNNKVKGNSTDINGSLTLLGMN